MLGLTSAKDKSRMLFTTRHQGDVGHVAACMAAPASCESFHTVTFLYDGGTKKWLSVTRNVVSGQWNISFSQAVAGVGREQKTVIKDVCFFDAVDYCAWFEETEKESRACREQDGDKTLHYRTVAEEACIPFDSKGQPHPAANGVIILASEDAIFDEHADAVAARTKGKALQKPAAPAARASSVLVSPLTEAVKSAPAGVDQKTVLRQGMDKARLLETFNKVSAALSATDEMLRVSVECYFKKVVSNQNLEDAGDIVGAVGGVAGGVFLVGGLLMAFVPSAIIGGALLISGVGLKGFSSVIYPSASYQFAKAHKALRSAIKDVPKDDEEARKTLMDYYAQALGVYKLERAAIIYRRFHGQKISAADLKEGVKLIAQARKDCGFSEAELSRLQHGFLNNSFPESWSFVNQLRPVSDGAQKLLTQRISALER